MIMWQPKDVAIAVRTSQCSCGEHGIKERATYRVHEIFKHPSTEEVYISVSVPAHFYPHDYFRREQPANTDVFSLAKRSKPKVAQPTPERV